MFTTMYYISTRIDHYPFVPINEQQFLSLLITFNKNDNLLNYLSKEKALLKSN
jgi:hypothetical protein